MSRRTGSQSQAEIAAATKKLTELFILFEKCSSTVRHLPDANALLNEAKMQWRSYGFVEPPVGDQAKISELDSALEAICASQPTDPIGIFIVMCAASTRVKLMMDHEIRYWRDRDRIITIAGERAYKECMRTDQTIVKTPDSPSSFHSNYPGRVSQEPK